MRSPPHLPGVYYISQNSRPNLAGDDDDDDDGDDDADDDGDDDADDDNDGGGGGDVYIEMKI